MSPLRSKFLKNIDNINVILVAPINDTCSGGYIKPSTMKKISQNLIVGLILQVFLSSSQIQPNCVDYPLMASKMITTISSLTRFLFYLFYFIIFVIIVVGPVDPRPHHSNILRSVAPHIISSHTTSTTVSFIPAGG